MAETLNPSPSTETEQRAAITNVVIMYPDVRTTGGSILNSDEIKSTLAGDFYSTAQQLLRRYKNHGAHITGVVYQDTSADNFSPLFPYDSFDSLVSVPVALVDWNRTNHREMLERIYEELRINGNTVVGGYHAFDCVAAMSQLLEEKGHKVIPNLLLTDQLGGLLVAHKVRRILGPGYSDDERANDRENWNRKYQAFNEIVDGLKK